MVKFRTKKQAINWAKGLYADGIKLYKEAYKEQIGLDTLSEIYFDDTDFTFGMRHGILLATHYLYENLTIERLCHSNQEKVTKQ